MHTHTKKHLRIYPILRHKLTATTADEAQTWTRQWDIDTDNNLKNERN